MGVTLGERGPQLGSHGTSHLIGGRPGRNREQHGKSRRVGGEACLKFKAPKEAELGPAGEDIMVWARIRLSNGHDDPKIMR